RTGRCASSSWWCTRRERTPETARAAVNRGVLRFFDLAAAYRNQVFGHGAPHLPAFYEDLGPLLLAAAREVLRPDCLFGGLTLAVATSRRFALTRLAAPSAAAAVSS